PRTTGRSSLPTKITPYLAHGAGPVRRWSFQTALGQFILVQTEIMAEFVQIRRADLLAENPLIALRKIPKIFQKQNDLRRQWNISFLGEFRPGEQTERIGL